MTKITIPEKWQAETKAIRAIQIAFELEENVHYLIRRDALEHDVTPSERMRQILGLASNHSPQRPRLSISLKPEDFIFLADKYNVPATDRASIKQKASLELQAYADNKKLNNERDSVFLEENPEA